MPILYFINFVNCFVMLSIDISPRKLLIFISIFSLLVSVLLFFLKIYISLSFLPDISGSETSTIFPIQRLTGGLPVYTDPESPPFLMAQYTPIYFGLVSLIAKVAGILPDDVHKVFIISRLFSISLVVTMAGAVGTFLRYKVKTSVYAALLAACFIYQVLAYWYLTSSRPDSLLVLLTTMLIIVVYRAIELENTNGVWWIAAIVIAVVAFFVKQSGAIHAIALGVFCLITAQWKLLFRLIISGLVAFGICLFILPTQNLAIFFTNIIGGVANSASWGWFYDWTLQRFLLAFAPLLAISTAICVVSFQNKSHLFLKFLSVCSVLFFLFATATATKIGAGVGYYQDYLIVAVVQIVVFVYTQGWHLKIGDRLGMLVTVIYLGCAAVHCLLSVYMGYTQIPLDNFRGQYSEQSDIAKFLKLEKGLRDGEWVYIAAAGDFQGYYLNHFLYRNSLVPFTDIVYLADQNKTFDFKKLDNLIRNRRIKYVIGSRGKEPNTILGQRFPALQKIRTTNSYDIYQGY